MSVVHGICGIAVFDEIIQVIFLRDFCNTCDDLLKFFLVVSVERNSKRREMLACFKLLKSHRDGCLIVAVIDSKCGQPPLTKVNGL